MNDSTERQNLISTLSVAFLLLIGWLIYTPAFGGTFLLDDLHNLAGLDAIRDPASALQYVLTGSAGPGGRPLALWTFALQADAWGGPAKPFLLVNVLIHLANGLLAYAFFRQLARTRTDDPQEQHWTAFAALALWLLLPLLASSSLMVIQRMTTLAATFMLLGLNAYLVFRSKLADGRTTALAGMTAAVILATVFAVMSKENGALLPALILVAEATLLSRPATLGITTWRTWRLVVLGIPAAVLAMFVVTRIPYDPVTVLERDFTAVERLLTEARVLWDYVFNALVARPHMLGPFHDNYPVARSLLEPKSGLAVVAWIAIVVAAIVYRRRRPLAAFAVLWFVTGHLLESTTIPLYLYFEHRNYVPLLGPAFAVAGAVFSVRGRYLAAARGLLGLAVAVNAGVLFSVTTLWGNPRLATAYWFQAAPDSAAAASHFAQQQLSSDGLEAGVGTLRTFAADNPQYAYLRLPEVTSICRFAPDRGQGATIASLARTLPNVQYSRGLGPMFNELLTAVAARDCVGVDGDSVRRLLDAALANRRYSGNPDYLSYHHQLLAKLAYTSGDLDEAVHQLKVAQDFTTHNDIDLMLVSTLAQQDAFDEARAVIVEARQSLPLDPRKRIAASLLLDDLERYLDALESSG